MHSRLMEIVEEKKREVARLKRAGLATEQTGQRNKIRDFKGTLSGKDKVSLIAEIKFASPSMGMIRRETDPVNIGKMYESAGASAISLLTDQKFFNGRLENLLPLKEAVSLPILRKDFIIDEIQIRESVIFGADAVLLIVRLLSEPQLKDLLQAAHGTGLSVLTEIHDMNELETALSCDASIIGINNRDLDTFKVDMQTTLHIAPLIPKRCIRVCESGIATEQDIINVKQCGVDAVLVGTSIMKSEDPSGRVKSLAAAGEG